MDKKLIKQFGSLLLAVFMTLATVVGDVIPVYAEKLESASDYEHLLLEEAETDQSDAIVLGKEASNTIGIANDETMEDIAIDDKATEGDEELLPSPDDPYSSDDELVISDNEENKDSKGVRTVEKDDVTVIGEGSLSSDWHYDPYNSNVKWRVIDGELQIDGRGDYWCPMQSPWLIDLLGQVQYVKTAKIIRFTGATGLEYMFYGFDYMTSVNNLENLDASNVESMRRMFYGCSKLKKLTLKGSKKCTCVTEIFEGCTSLESLDLSGFDMSGFWFDGSGYDNHYDGEWEVWDMLQPCKSLKEVKSPKVMPRGFGLYLPGSGWKNSSTGESVKFIAPGTPAGTLFTRGGGSTPRPQTCNVTFMSDGKEYTVQQVTKGERVPRPADPRKDNCSFAGWYTNDTFTTLYDFSREVKSNFRLYARWTRNYIVNGKNATMVAQQRIDLQENCFYNVNENITRYIVDNTRIATVSGKMLVGRTPGTVRVEAQIRNGKVYETVATCSVRVLNTPRLSFPNTLTYDGQTIRGSSYFTTSDTGIIGATYWESSNPAIVEVIDSRVGTLRAHKSGTVTIIAYFGEKGKTGTFRARATLKTKIPSFQRSEFSMLTGADLVITMRDVDRTQNPTWTVERIDGAYLTCISASPQRDSRGNLTGRVIVKGLNCGDSRLTATIDGHKYSCVIQVAAPKLNKYNITVKKGRTATISLQNTRYKKSQVSWFSANESIAKVDTNGRITGISPGETTIYTYTGGWWNECKVTVQ